MIRSRKRSQFSEHLHLIVRHSSLPFPLIAPLSPCNPVQLKPQQRPSDSHATVATVRKHGVHERTTRAQARVIDASARERDVPIARVYRRADPLCTAPARSFRHPRIPLRPPQVWLQPFPIRDSQAILQPIQPIPRPSHPPHSLKPNYMTKTSQLSLPAIP